MSKVLPRGVTFRAMFLVAAESALIVGAIWTAAYIRFGQWIWVVMEEEGGLSKSLLIAAVCQICLYYTDSYDFRKVVDRRDLFVRVTQALGAASFIL